MNASSHQTIRRFIKVSARALGAALLITLAATSVAQDTISKEEYAKRQAGLMKAIAAMEAAEARASAANLRLKQDQAKTAPGDAEMERSVAAAPALADDSATIARAKANIAAREARIRRDSPADVIALLDAPPTGGVPVEGNGPAPGAKPISQAERDAARKKQVEAEEVEILCQGGCTFDSKANLVVFEGNVVVKHPQFDLVCDKLIVFLKKNAKEGESSMDKAIATGKRVTIRQVDAAGDVQVGQARKVTFEDKTGNVILEDWPQVQTGTKLVQAKEQGTIIILKQDKLEQNSEMKINGPSITKLILPTADDTVPAKTP